MRNISDDFNALDGELADWFFVGQTWATTNRHVDLRSFYNYGIERPRTQGELDLYTQAGLEAIPLLTQRGIETAISVSGEFWSVTGTGFVNSYDWENPPDPIPAGSPVIGALASLDNQRAMELTTTSDVVSAALASSIPFDAAIPDTVGIDISAAKIGADGSLSVVMAGDLDRSSFTAATSFIQLSSASDGGFGTASSCTAQIPFTSNTSATATELRLLMSAVLAGAGADFDSAKVRGVRIELTKGAGSAGQKLRVMAIRAVSASWVDATASDIETRRGVLQTTPNLLGNTAARTPRNIIRGTDPDDGEDARFVDGTMHLYFSAGGEAERKAVGATRNSISLLLRERDSSDKAEKLTFAWSTTGVVFTLQRLTGGLATASTLATTSSPLALDRADAEDLTNGVGLDAEVGRYCLQISLAGSNIEARVFQATSANVLYGAALAVCDITDTRLAAVRGRVGISTDFADRDAFIDEVSPGVVGYATIRTMQYASYTPVDGAQLIAAHSDSQNLFSEFIYLDPSETFIDNTKTLSGLGSYRTRRGLLANQFLVEDWTQTRVEFDLWVGGAVRRSNQPKVALRAVDLDEIGNEIVTTIPLPLLRANQWNHVEIDLARFANLNSNLFYTLEISPGNIDLGTFWVEGMIIHRRLVEWQLRAAPDRPWRNFRDLVNDQHGALHLAQGERGRVAQVQGIALTRDAWVARMRLLPRYAQLGTPLYDQSFQTG